jgi:pimeloyl-ACP methyl ester carboxylesterase
MNSPRVARALAIALLVTPFVACVAVPVRVTRADPTEVQRDLTSNVLNTGEPSTLSTQLLQRRGLYDRWREEPQSALAELQAGLGTVGDQYRLFALSELSYHYAQAHEDSRYYLAAAVYAYALLFPGSPDVELLEPADPRIRVACDLYNRGLAEALKPPGADEAVLAPGLHPLPFGGVEVAFDPASASWAGYRLERFVPAADLRVHGLRNRYRRAGIGAPLVAGLSREETAGLVAEHRRIPETLRVPVTAFLRLEQPRQDLVSGWLRGSLEIYSQDDALALQVDGREWPLEFETSSALATMLADSPWWDFEVAGFFSGALQPFASEKGAGDGLLLVHPYRRGRIPVVLVHGTASSPARWADLVNELEIDRRIWDRYQIWLYIYNTGNPVGYSGGVLRESLEKAVRELDPEGTDPALRRMVVIGHSQGGLLARLTAIDSGTLFWDELSSVPIERIRTDAATRGILRRSSFFTPEPFVGRVIFVCTPHRGSYLAAMSLGRIVASLVALPSDLTASLLNVATLNQGKLKLRALEGFPTSIDDMNPRNSFIRTLAAIPIAPGIHVHSIVAVKGDGPLEDASDGVVAYESAHLESVASEKVVRSGHSAQGNAEVIEEIRRILLLALEPE